MEHIKWKKTIDYICRRLHVNNSQYILKLVLNLKETNGMEHAILIKKIYILKNICLQYNLNIKLTVKLKRNKWNGTQELEVKIAHQICN